jgi:two-component system nitrogen regulation response regulator GlnG
MQQVFKLVGRVAASDVPVMITGESGTGKELIARALHLYSQRSHKTFLAINCAAIPETLLESELFGHEKGAFTGANSLRIGRFEQCDGGTLFLDEIGEMPLATQSKLLRVLQEGEFSRVGGNQTLRTDVRIVAATNRNLEQEVAAKNFREDLFYRLNVVRIHLPPLRQRVEDIRLLAEYFLRRIANRQLKPMLRLSEEAIRVLEAYSWPGNVRELENTMQRASVLATTDVLLPQDIPLGQSGLSAASAGEGESLPTQVESLFKTTPVSSQNLNSLARTFLKALEKSHGTDAPLLARAMHFLVQAALEQCNGREKDAAKLLGITPAALRKQLLAQKTGPIE